MSIDKLKDLTPKLMLEINCNAIEKGFWPQDRDIHFASQHLMLIVTEVSEAVEAIRISKFAELDKFNNCMGEQSFTWCFEEYIKNSFEDEIADVAIRLMDYAQGFDLKVNTIQKYMVSEYETLAGTHISNVPSFLLNCVRSISDIHYNNWRGQYIGELLGKLFYLAETRNADLVKHIELKMKYNSMRPHKHGKGF